MNAELLRKIADVIEANPECHDQGDWSSNCDQPNKAEFYSPDDVHNCGTKACIAGWAVHLTPKADRPEADSISECAAKLLGLSESEANCLFNGDWSPREGVTVPQELRRIADQQSIGETATAGNEGTATAGNEGTATAGWKGTATAGWKGTATAGNEGTATAGNEGTATAGWKGTATAGWKGTATAGDEGTATAGDEGTATAGWKGTATAGDDGTATAGWKGTATAGWKGTATAGDEGTATAGWNGTATAGDEGTATAGENSVIVIYRIKNGSRIPVVGVIGETLDEVNNPLKPRTPYQLNSEGKFVEVSK